MIVTKMQTQINASRIQPLNKFSYNLRDEVNQEVLNQMNELINNSFSKKSHLLKNKNLSHLALQHHFSSVGHQFRARLCLDACAKLGVDSNDKLILAAATEILHNASLIHDDIQDCDEVRRGKPSVWKKYGQNIGICSGDLLLSAAYGILEDYKNLNTITKIIAKLHEKTHLAIEGQSEDVAYKHHQKNGQTVSIEQYVQIAKSKSGALLSLPLELALIAAEKNEHINTARIATEAFAVGYQIADDIDIAKDAGSLTKSRSINITFVLNALGYENEKEQSIAMCDKYLNDAIYHAQKLPNDSGLLLATLAARLKNKIKH